MNGIHTTLSELGPRAILGLALFAAFWVGAICARVFLGFVCRRSRVRSDVFTLASRLIYITLITVGMVTALGTVGVNVSALVAGLGLTGFALGFALKDALSNVLSGILVLVYRPFRVGDQIQVTGFEGEVIGIDLRYTILETPERRVLIPNANLFTNPVVILRAAVPQNSRIGH